MGFLGPQAHRDAEVAVTNRVLDVAVASDDRGAMPLAVTLSGLNRHLADDWQAHVRVMTTSMSRSVRDRLQRSAECWSKTRLDLVDIGEAEVRSLPQTGRHPRETYLRLLMPELFTDLSRVLYLDIDLLVQRDLSPLQDLDLARRPLAAVRDVAAPAIGEVEGLAYCFKNGSERPSRTAPTINAGVLIFDLDQWRSRRLKDVLIAFVIKHADKLRWSDQDAIHAELGHEIEHLPIYCNTMTLWRTHPPLDPVEARMVADWLSDPAAAEVVWHFAGRTKPWSPQSFRSPFVPLYREALHRSGWFPGDAAFLRWQVSWYLGHAARLLSRHRKAST